ncbi:MAG: RT0821/Lpp0805 family surface protein [Magnetospiraceae bacterium]
MKILTHALVAAALLATLSACQTMRDAGDAISDGASTVGRAVSSGAKSTAHAISEAFDDEQANLTERDKVIAFNTVQSALESSKDGQTRYWRNTKSGNSGAVRVVETTVTSKGFFCRSYVESFTIGGDKRHYDNRACRDGNGRWKRAL